jgi:glutamate carboxypeptidase
MNIAPSETAALNHLHRDSAEDRTARLLRWCAINSGSRNATGLAAMAAALRADFASLGGNIQMEPAKQVSAIDARGQSVALVHGDVMTLVQRPQAPIQVILAGHMDTVFAVDHSFQDAVWLNAHTLNAPGAADMKGGILVMLEALQVLEASPWAANIGYRVVINADEEVSSLGSAAILARHAEGAHFGLVYEPSMADGALAGARKGSGNFTLLARGLSAHAGRNPQDGRNALLAVADFAVQAAKLNGAREGLTLNAARIEGGSPENVVPDLALLRFNIRVAQSDDQIFVENKLRDLAHAISVERGVTLEISGHFARPPKPMDARQAALFAAVKLCGADMDLDIGWRSSGGCCDGNNLAANGLAVVDTLGVRGNHIHSSQEICDVNSIYERAMLSALMLMRVASGAYPVAAFNPGIE